MMKLEKKFGYLGNVGFGRWSLLVHGIRFNITFKKKRKKKEKSKNSQIICARVLASKLTQYKFGLECILLCITSVRLLMY